MPSATRPPSSPQAPSRRIPSRLIINADDFGLTPGVNRGIADLYRAGALSSATLMANAPAFHDAVATAKQLPGFGVGCHIVLLDGDPLSPPNTIPTLLSATQVGLRSSLPAFARAALLGQLNEAEIEREAAAQVTRLLDAGIRPTHLDSHKHTHLFPAVLRPLLRVAVRFGIRAIRNPFEQPWSVPLGRSRLARRAQVHLLRTLQRSFLSQPQIRHGHVRTTQGSIGIAATGDLDAGTLALLLERLPGGIWELVCHPGFSDADLAATSTRLLAARDIERQALQTIVPGALKTRAIDLVSFADLAEGQDTSST